MDRQMWASVDGKQRVMSKQTGKHGKLLLHTRSLPNKPKPLSYRSQAPPSGDVSLWWCLRHLLPFPNLAHHRPRAYLLYTGQFSLSQNIAPALGRPLQCIFSDGVCDEVELHGHSACVVSGLGLAAQALRKTCLKKALSWIRLPPSAMSVFVTKWWKNLDPFSFLFNPHFAAHEIR